MASNGVVVDASVILKWYLRDEDLLSEADQLLLDWRIGRLVLVEPVHVGHEVGHSLLRAHRRGRISAPLVEQAVTDFTVVFEQFVFMPAASLAIESFRLARSLGVSFYDATYLQVARLQSVPLVTADEAFFRQAGAQPEVRWLGDYPRGVL
jgi:predicted nucleic acid-binding protein